MTETLLMPPEWFPVPAGVTVPTGTPLLVEVGSGYVYRPEGFAEPWQPSSATSRVWTPIQLHAPVLLHAQPHSQLPPSGSMILAVTDGGGPYRLLTRAKWPTTSWQAEDGQVYTADQLLVWATVPTEALQWQADQ